MMLQRYMSRRLRTQGASKALQAAESAVLEHAQFVGFVAYFTLTACAGHTAGIGSSYLNGLASASAIVTLVLNDYVLRAKGVHLASYMIMSVSV